MTGFILISSPFTGPIIFFAILGVIFLFGYFTLGSTPKEKSDTSGQTRVNTTKEKSEMTVRDWTGVNLILLIPFFNLFMLVKWISDDRNKTLRNYALGLLLAILIFVVITAMLIYFLGVSFFVSLLMGLIPG